MPSIQILNTGRLDERESAFPQAVQLLKATLSWRKHEQPKNKYGARNTERRMKATAARFGNG